jgi:hypothetical protein
VRAAVRLYQPPPWTCPPPRVVGVPEYRARSWRAWRPLPGPRSVRVAPIDPGAPRVFRTGFPGGLPLLIAHGGLPRGVRRSVVVPSFVPLPVYARLRADAREGRDGKTGGTIPHGVVSSAARFGVLPEVPVKLRALSSGMRMSSLISTLPQGLRKVPAIARHPSFPGHPRVPAKWLPEVCCSKTGACGRRAASIARRDPASSSDR